MSSCPCGLGEPYEACCGRYHRGEATAPTALALMRSRFTAFALGETDYLTTTWHSSTRPADLELVAGRRWTDLQILGHTGGGLFEATGSVEFRARYRENGRAGEQQENSRFVREDGQWRYLAGA
ncbi:MAG: YchJ family protein [Jatrophihabitans sp.]